MRKLSEHLDLPQIKRENPVNWHSSIGTVNWHSTHTATWRWVPFDHDCGFVRYHFITVARRTISMYIYIYQYQNHPHIVNKVLVYIYMFVHLFVHAGIHIHVYLYICTPISTNKHPDKIL